MFLWHLLPPTHVLCIFHDSGKVLCVGRGVRGLDYPGVCWKMGSHITFVVVACCCCSFPPCPHVRPKPRPQTKRTNLRRQQEERVGLRNVQRAARKATQSVPDGASVVLYDFADPDDFDYDEEEDARGASTGFGTGGSPSTAQPTLRQLQAWKRTKRGKEEKLPCVRLLSGVHKDDDKGQGSGSGSGDGVQDGGGGGGDTATGEEWVELPTVPVLLESMGKVKRESVLRGGGQGRAGGRWESETFFWGGEVARMQAFALCICIDAVFGPHRTALMRIREVRVWYNKHVR